MSAAAATVDGPAWRVEGERAYLELPDYSLRSYETLVRVRAALPRVEAVGPLTLACAAAELVRLGIDVRAQLGGFDGAEAHLFEDQRYLVDVAIRRKRFAIYAECGFGKTACLLAWALAVVRRTWKRVLIVTPLAVVPQVFEEYARFYPGEPELADVRALGGIAAWRADVNAPAIGVVNVDAFRKAQDLEGLGGLVLDEASVLKAMAGTLRNAIVRSVAPVEYRLACSATPAPNDLEEYVSQALFLGVVRTHKEFFADFFQSDGEGGWSLRGHARAAFYEFMASWSVWVRDPATYGFPARLGGVPAPVFVDVHVPATAEQVAESRAHRKTGHLFLDEVGVVKRGKLAQLSRGFLYEKGKPTRAIASHKPAAVADAVCAHPGERAVVWVTYNEEARLIAEALRARGRAVAVVDGDTPDAERDAAVRGINRGGEGAPDVLVAKPATLGFGLNLQGASVCVFSGVSDSFEQDYQAFRRLFRYGQRQRVTCYYVFTDFEAPMLANVRAKRAAWEAQAEAMERAYRAACGAELDLYRGGGSAAPTSTQFRLTDADRRALARVARTNHERAAA